MKKTCLITGAASGIGYEFAKIFHSHNYNLVLIDLNIERLIEIKKDFEIVTYSNTILLHKDLSKPNIAEEIYEELIALKISIDVLINNAGFGIHGFFHKTDWNHQKNLINLTVLTTTHLTKLFLKDMVQRNSGKILNVSSIASFQPGPLMSVYYASKAFLTSFSQAISNELKGTNVSVTLLCPGMTKTGFQKTTGNEKGKFGMLISSPQKVAEYGYKAMLKDKMVAIPCFYNRIIANIQRFITWKQAVRLSRFMQERNRKSVSH